MSPAADPSYREMVLDRARTGFSRFQRQDLADLALAVIIAVLAMLGTLTGSYGDRDGLVLLLDLAITLPLALRRRYPLATFVTILAMIDVRALLLSDLDGAGVFLGLLIGVYSLAAHARLPRAVAGIIAFVPAIIWASWLTTGNPYEDLAFIATLVGGFWLAGRVVWSRNRLVEQLAEQAEELRRSRDAEARARVAEQRARIGRDVHDVVAHSVSLMVVQAEAGEAQLAHDHPSSECLRAIQRVGRSTLNELRTVLGALADDRDRIQARSTTGGPGLRDVHLLAADLAEAGLHVDLQVEGDVGTIAGGVDVAAYRILQEALTNTLRHSPGARVSACVSVTPGEVIVDVVDSGGTRVAPDANGTGRGLIGMQERAALYGGQVQAGPTDDGFQVHARIPDPFTTETSA